MGRHVACMEEKLDAGRNLVGKPEGKGPLGTPGHSWEHNITVDLKEVGWEGVDWTYLAQDKDQLWDHLNIVVNLLVHEMLGCILSS
jgi:hypothetical protein